MVSSISAAKNTYFDNPNHASNTLAQIRASAYNPPAYVVSDDGTIFTVIAYPSSCWDDWEWRAYRVTWSHNVWIDSINGYDAQSTTPVTTAYITFNPKDTQEGELTVTNSADGKHNGCDFSAITGFEKEESWTHLSIWKSRGSVPVPV
jgi:hypothetical protein